MKTKCVDNKMQSGRCDSLTQYILSCYHWSLGYLLHSFSALDLKVFQKLPPLLGNEDLNPLGHYLEATSNYYNIQSPKG